MIDANLFQSLRSLDTIYREIVPPATCIDLDLLLFRLMLLYKKRNVYIQKVNAITCDNILSNFSQILPEKVSQTSPLRDCGIP